MFLTKENKIDITKDKSFRDILGYNAVVIDQHILKVLKYVTKLFQLIFIFILILLKEVSIKVSLLILCIHLQMIHCLVI